MHVIVVLVYGFQQAQKLYDEKKCYLKLIKKLCSTKKCRKMYYYSTTYRSYKHAAMKKYTIDIHVDVSSIKNVSLAKKC